MSKECIHGTPLCMDCEECEAREIVPRCCSCYGYTSNTLPIVHPCVCTCHRPPPAPTCPECGWERDNTGIGKHVCHPLPSPPPVPERMSDERFERCVLDEAFRTIVAECRRARERERFFGVKELALRVEIDDKDAEIAALRQAVEALYFSANWHPDRDVDAIALWTAVRDAAGIVPGQTAKRVGPDRGCALAQGGEK